MLRFLFLLHATQASLNPPFARTHAMRELVEIMQEVGLLHNETEKFVLSLITERSPIPARTLHGFMMYRQVVANFLEPGFTEKNINQSDMAVAVAHESVGDAADAADALFHALITKVLPVSPTSPEHEKIRQLWTFWLYQTTRLAELRLKYGITLEPFLPKVAERVVDKKATEYLDQLDALFNSIRQVMEESYKELATFDAWTSIKNEEFVSIVRSDEDTIVESIASVIAELENIRAMVLHEDLISLAKDSTEIEAVVKQISERVFDLSRKVTRTDFGSNNPVTEFGGKLKTVLCPKWKRLCVQASVLRGRIQLAIDQQFQTRGLMAYPHIAGIVQPPSSEPAGPAQEPIMLRSRRKKVNKIEPQVVTVIDPEEREKALRELLEMAENETTPKPITVARLLSSKKPVVLKTTPQPPVVIREEENVDEFVGIATAETSLTEFQSVLSRKSRKMSKVIGTSTTTTTRTTTTTTSRTTTTTATTTTIATTTTTTTTSITTISSQTGSLVSALSGFTRITNGKRARKILTTAIPVSTSTENSRVYQSDMNTMSPATLNHPKDEVKDQTTVHSQIDAHFDNSTGHTFSRPRNPCIEYCLMRLGVLSAQSRSINQEISYLCDQVAPLLWSSGDIECAQSIGMMDKIATSAHGYAAYMESLASHAFGSHYNRQ